MPSDVVADYIPFFLPYLPTYTHALLYYYTMYDVRNLAKDKEEDENEYLCLFNH